MRLYENYAAAALELWQRPTKDNPTRTCRRPCGDWRRNTRTQRSRFPPFFLPPPPSSPPLPPPPPPPILPTPTLRHASLLISTTARDVRAEFQGLREAAGRIIFLTQPSELTGVWLCLCCGTDSARFRVFCFCFARFRTLS